MATVNVVAAAQRAPEIGTFESGARANLAAISLDRIPAPYLDPDMPISEAFLAHVRSASCRTDDGTQKRRPQAEPPLCNGLKAAGFAPAAWFCRVSCPKRC